ncbi:MAG: class I SAM-dependent methyltransferase [Cyanobacteria bacterium P01_D01_bin.56]
MLLNEKDVFDMLICPKSGLQLVRVGEKFISKNPSGDIFYETLNGYPILIDFNESVLSREDIAISNSVVTRYSYQGLIGALKKAVSPPKKATARNVSLIFEELDQVTDSPKVLVVGGGTVGQGMERFYTAPHIELISFDIYASPNVQFLADAHNIPLPSQCFDAVIVQAVLEHVLEPQKVVSEIYRVLKPHGIVYAETPFLQHVHEGAYDFTRFTESGHRYLFKCFKLIQSGSSAGAGTQLVWSLDNFFRGIFRSRNAGKFVKLCCFWIQYLDDLIPESYNIDAASGVFFLGRKSSTQTSKKTIISHYKGAQK